MKKLKPNDNSIENWFKKYPSNSYMVSDKLDGTSSMLYFSNGKTKLFTRGSHDYGRDISHLIPYLVNVDGTLEKANQFFDGKMNIKKLALRGEIIMSKKNFIKYRQKGFTSGSRTIANALVIRKTIDEELVKDVDFVLFEVVEPRLPKNVQFELLKYLGFKTTYNKHYTELNKTILSDILDKRKNESEYDIDGLIVEDNEKIHKLANQKTPDYAFAYKKVYDDLTFEVPVTKVVYEASKDGVLVPVVHYQPINYKGDILKKATGFNAKFIKDNGIGEGAIIKIIRAGEIIPYITGDIVKKVEPQMPNVDYEWNKSGVDAILVDHHQDESVKTKLLVNFFTKMEFPYINHGFILKFMNNGYDTIDKILNITKTELMQFDGVKETMANKIYESINESYQNVKPEVLMSASNSFGKGFGKRRIKMILEKYPDIVQCYNETDKDELIDKINEIDGFQIITSKKFVEHLGNFCEFLEKNILLKKVFYDSETVSQGELLHPKLFNLSVVMTGFRDKELSDLIDKNGGKVLNTVTKNVDIVITKDESTTGTKIKKANELGVATMSLLEFKKEYL